MADRLSPTVRAENLPEIFLRRTIRIVELLLESAAGWITLHRVNGQPDREASWRLECAELTAEHAAIVAVYERRFGELPRMPLGTISLEVLPC